MLKLKEEATKLSQRYKIVATELKNIATAITINKKQQRTVQNSLSKIRHQHQILIKRYFFLQYEVISQLFFLDIVLYICECIDLYGFQLAG